MIRRLTPEVKWATYEDPPEEVFVNVPSINYSHYIKPIDSFSEIFT